MTLFQQSAIESGARFEVFDGAAIGAGIDLTTTYPGYGEARAAQPAGYPGFERGEEPLLPRKIIFVGGQLDVVLANGDTVSITDDFAGMPLEVAPASVADSSTATGLLVIW